MYTLKKNLLQRSKREKETRAERLALNEEITDASNILGD